MSKNFLTILAIVLLAVFVFYYFNQDGAIANQGAVDLYPTTNRTETVNGQQLVSRNAVSLVNSSSNSNVEFVPLPEKKVHFNDTPQVKNVPAEDVNRISKLEAMIYPKFSNDFAPRLCPIDALPLSQPLEKAADIRLNLSCYPRDTVIADDLKPIIDPNSAWTKMNPSNPGSLLDKNFLDAGYMIGVNTQGSSLRNPNLSLRPDPPIPRAPVAWTGGISTIEPDLLRRNLGI